MPKHLKFQGASASFFKGDPGMLQLPDIEVIASVARYYTLTRGQINRLHFPTDHDGRITRKRLRLIHDEGLVNRTNMQVVNPSMGCPRTCTIRAPKDVRSLLRS